MRMVRTGGFSYSGTHVRSAAAASVNLPKKAPMQAKTIALLATAAIACAANAQAVRTEKNMSLELASQIATHSIAACAANGYAVAAPWWTAPARCARSCAPTTPAPTPWRPAA